MRNRFGEMCRWHADPAAESSLDSLQAILNCASVQGCRECVPCSERGLALFRKLTQGGGRSGE